MSKKCLKCGLDCSDSDKFCIRCGTRFDTAEKNKIICPDCGYECEENSKFCIRCGKPLKNVNSEESSSPEAKQNDRFDKAEQNGRQNYNHVSSASYGGSVETPTNGYSYENKAESLKKTNKVLFALAFVSLLLDLIYGLGAVIAFVVFLFAINSLRKKKTATATWATVISAVSFAFGIVFFVCMLMVI